MTASTPLAVEKVLIKNIPSELVHKAHHWLILHGRYTCLARSPKCATCGITALCKHFEKEAKKKEKLKSIKLLCADIVNSVCGAQLITASHGAMRADVQGFCKFKVASRIDIFILQKSKKHLYL